MIESAQDYPLSQIIDIESKVIYVIPRFQRQYSWRKREWENLIEDLLDNDPGYYLGSIICINTSRDSLGIQTLEVVDGQQRLLTISLLYAAIYNALKEMSVENDLQFAMNTIERKLVLKKMDFQLRLVPQIQNNNHADYVGLLSQIGIHPNMPTPSYAGNRRIFLAYNFFKDYIDYWVQENGNSVEIIEDLLNKVNSATLVKIEVSSHADAYTLFESLNTRGMPLTSIDLIKNKLLAQMEREETGNIDHAFNQWTQLLGYLGDDHTTQERFFRQYYNAFREELKQIYSVPVATRSNLIPIYEKLIDSNPSLILSELVESGKRYSMLLNPEQENVPDLLRQPLIRLERIQATPSYLLLLFLLNKREELDIDDHQLEIIIQTLVRFFVRRNLTDTPPTRDLTRLFIDIISQINDRKGYDLLTYLEIRLKEVSASDEKFRHMLGGPIYAENSGVTRFILCELAEQAMTLETMTDLWQRADKNKNYVWTIEHILPQGENIPEAWVQMIANGDREQAKNIQQELVHTIGNLTITGFNSTLGNKSFQEKKERKDQKGHFVGYRNGLSLNEDLLLTDNWGSDQIKQRTEKLVSKIMELYRM